jgi:hypothetical protein
VLVPRGESYAIEVDGEQLDLHRFERLLSAGTQALADGDTKEAAAVLREALGLWRGPALADFSYEPFANPAVSRLEELRLTALEQRIEADLELGLHAQLVAELKELIAAHPLRERLRAHLMLALYRDGRQAEALELYRQTRETFIERLGIEPGPGLQELHAAVLRQEPELAPAKPLVPMRSILVAPRGTHDLGPLLALAEALARRPARELILARLLPPGSDLGEESVQLNERRQELLGRGVAVRTAAFTTASRADDLVRLAREQDVDLLLLEGTEDDDVLAHAPCDVAVYVARGRPPPAGPVFVLFGGGEHDWTAIELGAWIAGAGEVPLRIAGPAPPGERDASRALASASLAVQGVLGVAAEPVLVAPGDEAVLAAVADAAVVVAGLPERWRHDGLGPVRTALADRARPPVLLVRRGLRPGGLAPRESLTRFTWTIRPAP